MKKITLNKSGRNACNGLVNRQTVRNFPDNNYFQPIFTVWLSNSQRTIPVVTSIQFPLAALVNRAVS